jgi:hypothetical protein
LQTIVHFAFVARMSTTAKERPATADQSAPAQPQQKLTQRELVEASIRACPPGGGSR